MTPKKEQRGPGRPSTKKSGTVAQSLRVTVQQNKQYRKASSLQGLSINSWMIRWLDAAATVDIENHTKESETQIGKARILSFPGENEQQPSLDSQTD